MRKDPKGPELRVETILDGLLTEYLRTATVRPKGLSAHRALISSLVAELKRRARAGAPLAVGPATLDDLVDLIEEHYEAECLARASLTKVKKGLPGVDNLQKLVPVLRKNCGRDLGDDTHVLVETADGALHIQFAWIPLGKAIVASFHGAVVPNDDGEAPILQAPTSTQPRAAQSSVELGPIVENRVTIVGEAQVEAVNEETAAAEGLERYEDHARQIGICAYLLAAFAAEGEGNRLDALDDAAQEMQLGEVSGGYDPSRRRVIVQNTFSFIMSASPRDDLRRLPLRLARATKYTVASVVLSFRCRDLDAAYAAVQRAIDAMDPAPRRLHPPGPEGATTLTHPSGLTFDLLLRRPDVIQLEINPRSRATFAHDIVGVSILQALERFGFSIPA